MRLLSTMAVINVVLLASLAKADDKPQGPERWEKSMQKFEASDAEKFPKKGGVLFIGSSSIRLWDLKRAFPDAEYLNRGFGGSEISDSIHFADRIVFPYEPRAIVMYAGDNDIAKGKTAERVAADFEKFVKLVHSKLPKTKIIFIAVKPSIKRWALIETVRDANHQIAAICAKRDLLAFADIDKPMIGDDGKPMAKLFVDDGLHLNAKGYEVWKGVVQPLLPTR